MSEKTIKELQDSFEAVIAAGGLEAGLKVLSTNMEVCLTSACILLDYSNPSDKPPPAGTPEELLAMQAGIHEAIGHVRRHVQEGSLWLGAAVNMRLGMTDYIQKMAPKPSDGH